MTLRDDQGRSIDSQRVDVDPIEGEAPLVLAIVSDDDDLALRAAEFLHREAGGDLSKA